MHNYLVYRGSKGAPANMYMATAALVYSLNKAATTAAAAATALEEGPAAGAGQALRRQRLVHELVFIQHVLLILIVWIQLIFLVIKFVLRTTNRKVVYAGFKKVSNSFCLQILQ